MKEIPILFNGEMVRAILDGRKTQTRRPIDKLPRFGNIRQLHKSTTPGYDWQFRCKRGLWQDFRHDDFMKLLAKFGRVGDRLWVRETFGPCEGGVIYKVDECDGVKPDDGKWTPSIHMPRWA